MEYFIVLFGIRYDKHWRKPKPKTSVPMPTHNNQTTTTPAPTTAPQTAEIDVNQTKIMKKSIAISPVKDRRLMSVWKKKVN